MSLGWGTKPASLTAPRKGGIPKADYYERTRQLTENKSLLFLEVPVSRQLTESKPVVRLTRHLIENRTFIHKLGPKD